MPPDPVYLYDFKTLPAKHAFDQSVLNGWFAAANAQSELLVQQPGTEPEREEIQRLFRRKMAAIRTGRIRARHLSLDDYTHQDWGRMDAYPLDEHPSGKGTLARSLLFKDITDRIFEGFYPVGATPPGVILHVTSMGYTAPSGAQRLVGERHWEDRTEVINLYHMECYASIPAILVASGLGALGKERVDLVHTEVCSLHFDPRRNSQEQMVVQSLFGDGFIRYTASRDARGRGGLELVAVREELIPGTHDDMGWVVGDFGFQFHLARKVPELIKGAVAPFLARLLEDAGLGLESALREAVFAIHPGGPRIIDEIANSLGLREDQVQASNEVLAQYGNMSSASLPHVWKAILEDAGVAPGTCVVALAFGPGLTAAGAVLRKRGPEA